MSVPVAGALLPLSAVIATRDRAPVLRAMLDSLARQSRQPAEIVLVDASADDATERMLGAGIDGLGSRLVYRRATRVGAAVQRAEGVPRASETVVLFADDDIEFRPECIAALWDALRSDPGLGGVNAMIENQRYVTPGPVSAAMFRFLAGAPAVSYAGRCIGPAVNLLPEDRDELPAVVPVEWLNLTCTMYRRAALPDPPFHAFFEGYSLMEDVALSLEVGRRWRLANVRRARIVHHSQPGAHKDDVREVARMSVVNRYFVMTRILGRSSGADHLRFLVFQAFQIASTLRSASGWRRLPAFLRGRLAGLLEIGAAWRGSGHDAG